MMRMVRFRLLFLLTLIWVVPGAGLQAQDEAFSRHDMLASIGTQVILPLHQEFASRTGRLAAITQQFEREPTLETLQQAQEEWRAASVLWQQAAIFRIGRMALVLHSPIDNRIPAAVNLIEATIAGSDRIDPESVVSLGSSATGLAASEYLLFGSKQTPEQVLAAFTDGEAGIRRRQYLAASTALLQQQASTLLNYWLPGSDGYLDTFTDADDPSDVRESISMLANAMIASLETVVQMDMGVPLGITTGTLSPELTRAPYSGDGLAYLDGYFDGLWAAFTGERTDEAQLGLDDYLDLLGAGYDGVLLSQIIRDQMVRIRESIEAVDLPLRQAIENDYASVARIFQESRVLLTMLKADMVSQLGLTITFSDNDGD